MCWNAALHSKEVLFISVNEVRDIFNAVLSDAEHIHCWRIYQAQIQFIYICYFGTILICSVEHSPFSEWKINGTTPRQNVREGTWKNNRNTEVKRKEEGKKHFSRNSYTQTGGEGRFFFLH